MRSFDSTIFNPKTKRQFVSSLAIQMERWDVGSPIKTDFKRFEHSPFWSELRLSVCPSPVEDTPTLVGLVPFQQNTAAKGNGTLFPVCIMTVLCCPNIHFKPLAMPKTEKQLNKIIPRGFDNIKCSLTMYGNEAGVLES